MEQFPNQIPEAEVEKEIPQKSIRERISMPHIEPVTNLLNEFVEKTEKEPINPETVKDILHAFLEQGVENTKIFTSEKYQVAFPYTVFDTGELAKKLFAEYAGKNPEISTPETAEEIKKKIEFVFGSFQFVQHGNEFTFMEEALHQVVKDLPQALEMIAEGKEPEQFKIYNIGSPTNELGSMSQEFLSGLHKDKAFDSFGKVYAELVESVVKGENENTTVFMKGFSMGGALAAETAQDILHSGVVAQSYEDADAKHIPFMQVRIDTPPASSPIEKEKKRWQIPVGFLADVTNTMMTDQYVKGVIKNDRGFLTGVNEVLAERGISVNMTPEQESLKKKGIMSVIENLRNGVALPEDVKITEVVGIYDPLMYEDKFRRDMQRQSQKHEGSLGAKLKSKTENRRTFGASMAHTIPFFRDNELQRLYKAVKDLEDLKVS